MMKGWTTSNYEFATTVLKFDRAIKCIEKNIGFFQDLKANQSRDEPGGSTFNHFKERKPIGNMIHRPMINF